MSFVLLNFSSASAFTFHWVLFCTFSGFLLHKPQLSNFLVNQTTQSSKTFLSKSFEKSHKKSWFTYHCFQQLLSNLTSSSSATRGIFLTLCFSPMETCKFYLCWSFSLTITELARNQPLWECIVWCKLLPWKFFNFILNWRHFPLAITLVESSLWQLNWKLLTVIWMLSCSAKNKSSKRCANLRMMCKRIWIFYDFNTVVCRVKASAHMKFFMNLFCGFSGKTRQSFFFSVMKLTEQSNRSSWFTTQLNATKCLIFSLEVLNVSACSPAQELANLLCKVRRRKVLVWKTFIKHN